jgi:SAM-dependent methyltransferase
LCYQDSLVFQQEYDEFYTKSSVAYLDFYNGHGIMEIERKILDELNPRTIIDIGCGTGRRLFPYYIQKEVNFLGIEKNKKLVLDAPRKWRNLIYCADITKLNPATFELMATVDVVTMLCFAFGGLHAPAGRESTLKNISDFLPSGGYFFMDTYYYMGFEQRNTGLSYKIRYDFPPQYFPARKELENLAAGYGLTLIDEPIKQEVYGLPIIYLLFQKK